MSLISVTHHMVASVVGDAVQVHLFCAQTFSLQESCGVSLLIIQDPDLETQLLIYPGVSQVWTRSRGDPQRRHMKGQNMRF